MRIWVDVSAWLKAPLHGAQTVSQGIDARRARFRLVITLRPAHALIALPTTPALITALRPTRSHVGVLTRRAWVKMRPLRYSLSPHAAYGRWSSRLVIALRTTRR